MPDEPPVWTPELLEAPHEAPDKAGRVRRMFNRIAPRYELVNTLLSAGRDAAWRRRAVALAGVSGDDRVLDIGCGTGDFARAFARAGVRVVVGCDFAHEMLVYAARSRSVGPARGGKRDANVVATAHPPEPILVGRGTGFQPVETRARCPCHATYPDGPVEPIPVDPHGGAEHARAGGSGMAPGAGDEPQRYGLGIGSGADGVPPVHWCEADALHLPFRAGSFSVTSCAFSVRNFADLDGGLAEMYRVLQRGGRAVILEFTRPRNRLARFLYELYFHHVMPAAATLISGDRSGAYRYLPRSVVTFINAEEMGGRLRRAGFSHSTATPLTMGAVTVFVATRD